MNPGIVRAGLPAGDITYGRAFTAQPFGTKLVTMTLSGGQIHDLLKQQWCGRESPVVLQVSQGVSLHWSRGAAKAITGKPCADADDPVSDLRIDGVPVQPWQGFRVTVNSSLAGGGNQFYVLHSGGRPEDGAGRRRRARGAPVAVDQRRPAAPARA